ncbi:hypothetical protein ASG67_05760 [Sphingomonas sp. Leaf339]|uniref:AMP-binding protein n=1 Tax=Sphingomonas sp. Leaf339 TaxID=1736343 RepID=UPI0006F80A70|nr:AMP-binding protein [Sphingomonas sp. Leaf339]KQU55645.1 hypothetical protein ASG67_05760 [Sphingomonas sp. Leaf339]
MTLPLCRTAARRMACAIVAAEVRRLRAIEPPLPHSYDWSETLPIGDEGLGLDSIEQLGAIGALAETFGLDDGLLGPEPPRLVGAWVDLVMRRHAAGDGQITVATSGSTGSARPCLHAVNDLLREAQFLATQVPGRRRVMALVPGHHLYGVIWTAILPTVLDIPVVARAIGTPLDFTAGDLVIAVPDQWQAMLRMTRLFPADVVGISSAGPLDEGLATDLLARGLARLLDIYGSSETGGIAMRELPSAAYDLLPRWRLLPHGDGDWQLGDEHGRCQGLPDHVERIGERRLRPIGRRDGAVQVGGHNVWPGRVADVLRQIDGVADAAVRLHSNGRLKAFIVPDGDHQPTALTATITRVAAARLSPPERPCSLRFGDTLPRNMMGKLEDWI